MGTSEHFDAVVIGSGFGGSVSAHVLGKKGFEVCLLERGKAYPPGSFARTPQEMARNFWDPSKGQHGLFDLWAFDGIDALVSSGLGGGSLIYANVLLRKDRNWFVEKAPGQPDRPWPVSYTDLEPHYDAVEAMLHPVAYPYSAVTPKSLAFAEAAATVGCDTCRPPLAVTFRDRNDDLVAGEPIIDATGKRPWNLHDRTRSTCRLCGECDIGCNYGSKNTLDFNYLSAFAAMENGHIRTNAEVKSFRPIDDGGASGYVVEYVDHSQAADCPQKGVSSPTVRITTKRLVLAAGTFGSTYLLLRNAKHFRLEHNPVLGTRFCGNGDMLGMLRSKDDVFEPSRGTVITTTTRDDDAADPDGSGRGFYIQDGGYPAFASWLVEGWSVGLLRRAARALVGRAWARLARDPSTEIGAELGSVLRDGAKSAGKLPLLGMGRDTADGKMSLDRSGKYLKVRWNAETSKDYTTEVEARMAAMADALDAKFMANPLWQFRHRLVTVHALGGCPMGRNANEGVVDSYGRVFGFENFIIADGSVMPGPVGANPSLTIAALARRFATEMP